LDEQRPDAVRILDWPHAVGYLAQVAHARYGVDTGESKAWLASQRETLLHGDPQVVLARLRGLQEDLTLQAGDGPAPAALPVVTESLDYLQKRAEQLRYAAFRAAGYPIGSGAVESANKLVVEFRLKGAGMHWALPHVNPLVALRSMACSDRWEEGWPQLSRQWRREARAATLARRRRRQATRAALAQEHAPGAPARPAPLAVAPPAPTSLLAVLPADLARAAAAPATPAPTVRLHRRHPHRPAATHPWRAPFLARRSRAVPEI
jgi:hypothetical protein